MRQEPRGDSAPTLSTADARQGKTGVGVRYVLVISMFGAAVLMGIVYLVFFSI
jgi:hypothetical protein